MKSLTCPECGENTKCEMGDFDLKGNRIRKRTCECGFLGVSVEAWAPGVTFSEVAIDYRLRHREAARTARGSTAWQKGKMWYSLIVTVRKIRVRGSRT